MKRGDQIFCSAESEYTVVGEGRFARALSQAEATKEDWSQDEGARRPPAANPIAPVLERVHHSGLPNSNAIRGRYRSRKWAPRPIQRRGAGHQLSHGVRPFREKASPRVRRRRHPEAAPQGALNARWGRSIAIARRKTGGARRRGRHRAAFGEPHKNREMDDDGVSGRKCFEACPPGRQGGLMKSTVGFVPDDARFVLQTSMASMTKGEPMRVRATLSTTPLNSSAPLQRLASPPHPH